MMTEAARQLFVSAATKFSVVALVNCVHSTTRFCGRARLFSLHLRIDGSRLRLSINVALSQLASENSRRAPVPRLAPGYTVYRRPRMAEEGAPENAEAV